MRNQKEIYEALIDGKTLVDTKGNKVYLRADGVLNYDYGFCTPSEWSIKPEPLEFWVNVYDSEEWSPEIFTNKELAEYQLTRWSSISGRVIKVCEVIE